MSSIDTVPPNLGHLVGRFTNGDIGGVEDYVFNETTSLGGFAYFSDTVLLTFSAPRLLTIDPANTQGGSLLLNGCVNLTSVSAPLLGIVGGALIVLSNFSSSLATSPFPSLTTVVADFVVGGLGFVYDSTLAPLLASVGSLELSGSGVYSLPSLVTVGTTIVSSGNFSGTAISFPNVVTIGGTVALNCPNMVSLDVSSWVPTPGNTFSTFGSNSLNAASVNLVLRRCVLNAAFTTGSITLTGAPPSGQGVTDKATLIGRGVSVTTS